ncbi:MAG TPA: biopolymer transporter ExbD [Caldithrix sp.]|nr:biopolymer transporter ExbD [Calditrichaceae bacterium]HEM49182.1 biopolymer transporter ExbD [Caldithrix sp.]
MFLKFSKHREAEIPTSSLADIVFLLLIFFLVTTSINFEKGLDLVLPDFGIIDVDRDNLSYLLINDQNEIALDGEPILISQVSYLVGQKLDKNPLLIVSVKTDEGTDYGTYIDLLDELKMAWGNKPARISVADPE